jgi:GT2 family glycosyltransferase
MAVVPDVGVVILTRHRADLLERAARSVAGQAVPIEGVVVDNGPDEDTRRLADRLGWRYLTKGRNLSFAEANDWAMAEIGADRVVLMNNDATLQEGCLQAMLGHEAAAVGALILDAAGSVNHAGVRVPFDGYGPYHLGRGDDPERWAGRCAPTQATTFAAALLRRDAYLEAGGMDEGYWYGFEDVDLCLRIRERGGEVLTCRDARVIHAEKTTRGDEFDERNFERFRGTWLDTGRAELLLARWPELAVDEPPPAPRTRPTRRFLRRRRSSAAG